jgi:hypothetical protein
LHPREEEHDRHDERFAPGEADCGSVRVEQQFERRGEGQTAQQQHDVLESAHEAHFTVSCSIERKGASVSRTKDAAGPPCRKPLIGWVSIT